MTIYTDFYDDSIELLEEFGGQATFVKKGQTGLTDRLGAPIPDTSDIEVTGLMSPLLPYTSIIMPGTGTESDSQIKSGDKFVIFDAAQVVAIDMTIEKEGRTWRVKSKTVIDSVANEKVLQTLQLRA